MNKAKIFGLSLALIAVIVLAQTWRSQNRAIYTPTPAAAMTPAAPAAQPEFAASEAEPAVSTPAESAPAAEAGAPAEAAPAETPAQAASPPQ